MSYQVWQMAGGEPARDYVDLFLDHDVMFIGPGYLGDFNENYDRYMEENRARGGGASIISQIRRFVQDVKPGDRVLLRKGHRVEAIGLVPDDPYEWNPLFDDVYGWDLKHTRRVIWQRQHDKELVNIQKKRGLFADRKQIPTFTIVKDQKVLGPIQHLFEHCSVHPLKEMPTLEPQALSLDEIGSLLFAEGLSFDAAEKVKAALQRQQSFSKWYDLHGEESQRPTEHEVVAHMVVPLLLALGWSEQLLAVEWKRIDLAAFWGTPTTPEKCTMIVEAKGRGRPLLKAYEQAKSYVEKQGLSRCKKIVLTDGECIYVYVRQQGGFPDQPEGYLNVNVLRSEYLAPRGANAVQTLMSLTPARVTRRMQ